MAWNCINCESANDYSRTTCEVCGYERYFSISEVNQMIEQEQEAPTEIKKVQANFKRASTTNKKLRKENKDLIEKMEELQDFHDHYGEDMRQMEATVQNLKKNNLRLRIWLTVAALVVLFFILAKVSVQISF